MPRTLRYRNEAKTDRKVFLATPAYSGLSAAYTYALYTSALALKDAGIETELMILSENCHVDDSRNILVRDFLESDCTDLVFLDADLRWNAESLVKLIEHDADVVAGIYPLKEDWECYPVRIIYGDIWSDEKGLIEVEAVPTGFLKIRRHVLQELYDDAPKFKGKADADQIPIGVIFERTMNDGARWGGDYTFCRKWAAKGGKIYIDPEMTFDHYGETLWSGNYGDYLRDRNGVDNPKLFAAFERLRNGENSPLIFDDLFKYWGNSFAASPELLLTAYNMAKVTSGTILECGAGISTMVMGITGKEIHSLESDYQWYTKIKAIVEKLGLDNVHLHYSPIKEYEGYSWYNYDDVPAEFSLALNDGPCRAIGREGFYHIPQAANADWIIDDSQTELKYLEGSARKIHEFSERRPFAIAIGE